ncbi:MAG: glycosyltransferase family 2 protein [Desulfomonile tiedjei]|nr:glycosyltransferase family 2 protein [Desulfomonile tiedjei]
MSVRPVTIAMPVYNGEPFLRESIGSVLAQDFGDFEFVVCDNLSTDSTWEICNSYAAKDKRIRCHRNEKNWGALRNFHLARELSRSPLFKWHAHDDVLDPTFLGRCYRFLTAHSDYLACTSWVAFMDETGTQFLSQYLDTSLDSADPVERFKKFYAQGRNDYGYIYALMRKEATDQIRFRKVWGADWVFVTEMIARGMIHQIQEPLLSFRIRTNSPESYEETNGPVALWGARSSFLAFRNLRLNMAIASVIGNRSLLHEERRVVRSLFRANLPLYPAISRDIVELISHFTIRFPRLHNALRMVKRLVGGLLSRPSSRKRPRTVLSDHGNR